MYLVKIIIMITNKLRVQICELHILCILKFFLRVFTNMCKKGDYFHFFSYEGGVGLSGCFAKHGKASKIMPDHALNLRSINLSKRNIYDKKLYCQKKQKNNKLMD